MPEEENTGFEIQNSPDVQGADLQGMQNKAPSQVSRKKTKIEFLSHLK